MRVSQARAACVLTAATSISPSTVVMVRPSFFCTRVNPTVEMVNDTAARVVSHPPISLEVVHGRK